MKTFSKILTTILLLTVILSSFAGCTKQEQTAKPINTTLTVGLIGDINALDPAYAYDDRTNPVVNQITEGLLAFDSQNKLVPKLAKSWKCVNPTTYVYEIRNDVTFSDGTPMTADDVVFSLNRYKDPKVASYLAWMYSNVASIQKTGEWEVTVKLTNPDALWQYVPATSAGFILSEKYYKSHAKDFGKASGGLLGTGPFVFDSWVSGSQIVLKQNTKYWNKTQKIGPSKVVFKIIPDSTTRVNALISGQVDFIISPPLDMISQIQANKNLKTSKIGTFGVDYVALNTSKKPLNDVNVRKAIYYAVDVNSINKNIVKDGGTPANSYAVGQVITSTQKDLWGSFLNSAPDYSYNVATAKQYLAKSNTPNGFNATLYVSDSSANDSIALAIQQSLKQININISIKKLTSNDYFSYLEGEKKRDYDLLLGAWASDFPDPAGDLIPMYSSSNIASGGANAAAYSNLQVDKLLNDQTASTDTAKRVQDIQGMLKITANEVPYVMVNYENTVFAYNKRIAEYPYSASWLYNLDFQDFKFTK